MPLVWLNFCAWCLKSVKTTQQDKSFIKKNKHKRSVSGVWFHFLRYHRVFRLYIPSVTTFKSLTVEMKNSKDEMRVKVSTGALFHIGRAGLKMPQVLIWLSYMGHANQWMPCWNAVAGLYVSQASGFRNGALHCSHVIHFICSFNAVANLQR